MRVIAIVRDGEQHPVWAIRLARTAHQIAADSTAPHPIGLLPQTERKLIAVTPENARLLAGEGEIEVTLEPVGGSTEPRPTGPVLFRASLKGSG